MPDTNPAAGERPLPAPAGAGLAAATIRNRPVFGFHAELAALLARRLGPRHALVFARPVPQGGGIAWFTAAAGPMLAWQDLPPDRRAAMDAGLAAIRHDLAGLAEALQRADPRQAGLGAALQAAMTVPSAAHLHAVGDQPVLSFWGFHPQGGVAVDPFTPPVAATPAARRWWPWALLLLLALLAGLAAWWWWPVPAAPVLVAPPVVVAPPPVVPPPAPEPTPEPPPAPTPEPPPAPKPPERKAELPADRWARRDLGMLQGCWILGREGPAQQYGRNGEVVDRGITRAGRICFDAAGHGRRSSRQDYSFGQIACDAPITALFDAQGNLVTHQPEVRCSGARGSNWLERSMTCKRRNDDIADCVDRNVYGTYNFEFRHER